MQTIVFTTATAAATTGFGGVSSSKRHNKKGI